MLVRYWLRLKKWVKYGVGGSYQHVAQPEGAYFEVESLLGYFNDLRLKAEWKGARDVSGIPLVSTDTVEAFYFPIVIFQWGLGNYDAWLDSGKKDEAKFNNFIASANWAVSNLSGEGGWLCWTGLERPVISPFSAMAQGEGISLLARVGLAASSSAYKEAAFAAYKFLLDSGDHCLTRPLTVGVSLEEYPGDGIVSVLNGWIFALVGLWDYSFIADDRESAQIVARNFADYLANSLPLYDNGFWSNYDLSGNVASPFYHRLHIDQLRTLAKLFPQSGVAFSYYADRFESYENRKINRLRAVLRKIRQKILQPAVGEMR